MDVWRQAKAALLAWMGTAGGGVFFTATLAFSIWAATAIVNARRGGRLTMAALISSFRDALSAVVLTVVITAIFWISAYGYFFVRAAIQNTNENASLRNQVAQLVATNASHLRRMQHLANYVPHPTDAQLAIVTEHLARLAIGNRREVTIKFLQNSTSGANRVAYPLEQAFTRAGWTVHFRPLNEEMFSRERLPPELDGLNFDLDRTEISPHGGAAGRGDSVQRHRDA